MFFSYVKPWLCNIDGKSMEDNLEPPTFQDVLAAHRRIQRYLPPTPLIRPIGFAEKLGVDAYLKLENLQPIGAFKVRGGINLLSKLNRDENPKGVITASTGNHGQSIAYAGKIFDFPVTILAPRNSNPLKVKAMENLGAKVILYGKDFDEARLKAEQLAEEGYRYVHSANEPLLIAGVGTEMLEILEAVPDIDTIIVPIGGGSGACGACIVAKAVNPKIRVIGVQSEGAPSVYLSWKNKRLMQTSSANTFAEGLATRYAFELPFRILSELIDNIMLVSDDEIKAAIRFLFENARLVVEAAGAASTAAALKLRKELKGRKVALLVTGGNITPENFRKIVCA